MTYSNKLNKPYWTIGYKTNRGYRAVKFKNKSYLVHRLVAETYIPNPNNLPEIDHFPDRTRENNNYLNLRWADRTIQNRNNTKCDRVTSRGWKHTYENLQEYKHSYNTSIREKHRVYQNQYYKENRDKCRAIAKKYYKTHKDKEKQREARRWQLKKRILFSDGKTHEIDRKLAPMLQALPVKERIYDDKYKWKADTKPINL